MPDLAEERWSRCERTRLELASAIVHPLRIGDAAISLGRTRWSA
jgi:hypothetical protein